MFKKCLIYETRNSSMILLFTNTFSQLYQSTGFSNCIYTQSYTLQTDPHLCKAA